MEDSILIDLEKRNKLFKIFLIISISLLVVCFLGIVISVISTVFQLVSKYSDLAYSMTEQELEVQMSADALKMIVVPVAIFSIFLEIGVAGTIVFAILKSKTTRRINSYKQENQIAQ